MGIKSTRGRGRLGKRNEKNAMIRTMSRRGLVGNGYVGGNDEICGCTGGSDGSALTLPQVETQSNQILFLLALLYSLR